MWFRKFLVAFFSLFFLSSAFAKDFKKVEPSYKSMCISYLHTAKEMRKSPLLTKFSQNPEYNNQLNLVDKNISQAQESLSHEQFEACYYRAVSAILLMKSLSNIQKAKKHENPAVGR
jgi:non-homologous end joining protein Ku